jgi:hypothetical protein
MRIHADPDPQLRPDSDTDPDHGLSVEITNTAVPNTLWKKRIPKHKEGFKYGILIL